MCSSSGIDYRNVAPLVWCDGYCVQCSKRVLGEYPLCLRNISGERMYFCSYKCLELYREALAKSAN